MVARQYWAEVERRSALITSCAEAHLGAAPLSQTADGFSVMSILRPERTHRGGSQGLVSETPFAEKLSFPKYTDHGFLAELGCDSGLYPPFLDEVDGIRSFTLDKNVLIFFII